jgi:hypothetical protein
VTDDFDEEVTADREAVRTALMSSGFRKRRSPRKKKDDDEQKPRLDGAPE